MTSKEMFEALGYKQTRNDNVFIEYQDDSHGDGDYKYIWFNHMWKKYEVGYYDAVETKRYKASMVFIDEHEAITKQMKELGWIWYDTIRKGERDMKSIYEEVVEKLKRNKEVELYRFDFTESGNLDFYTDKVYKAEDDEKITRSVVLTSVFGIKYRLEKIKFIGTALIKGEPCLVKETLNYDNEPTYDLYYGDINHINQYSFSITEAMKEKSNDKSHLYFLGKDRSLIRFRNEAENKDDIELLLSKGLITKLEDFKEVENE